MRNIRLSICIPTYNFGQFIGETLDSIIKQAGPEIEIVVVDGASTDDTENVVLSFQRNFPKLCYHRLSQKGGIDRDLAKTIELAKGDYCWLMSSDDVLKSGAIQRALHEINFNYDIILCNRTECDRDLHPIKERFWLSKKIQTSIFNLSNEAELLNYFKASQSIGALFSYMSSIIFRREKWNEAKNDESFYGTHYAHVFRLFSIREKGCLLKYINKSHILCRGENDSFLREGIVKRFLIDIEGYKLLAHKLFLDPKIQHAFMTVMQREHKWYLLPKIKSKIEDVEMWSRLEANLLCYGYSPWTLKLINITGSSPHIMRCAQHTRRIIKRFKFFPNRIKSFFL